MVAGSLADGEKLSQLYICRAAKVCRAIHIVKKRDKCVSVLDADEEEKVTKRGLADVL